MNELSVLLNEIDALKEKINGLRSLTEKEQEQLQAYYKIGLTYTSNALEGNSLTETETKVVIEDGLTIGGKPLQDHFEALGHAQAYDFMYELIKQKDLTEEAIKKLHKLFYDKIDDTQAGEYRTERVFISGSEHSLPNPESVPELMKKFIQDIERVKKDEHPVVYAARVHKEFVFIHPFIDGNGRVSRLLMNIALLSSGYCVTIIPPVLRKEYIRTLEKAHKGDHEFVSFIASCVKESHKDYMRLIGD